MLAINILKKVATFAIFISSSLFIVPASGTPTCAAGGACAIGDTGPGGGTVFFVKSTYTNTSISTQNGPRTTSLTTAELAALPFDYLEAAPIGWDASSATDPSWNYHGSGNAAGYNTISDDKIGTGKNNTELMKSLNPSDNASNNIAYKLASTSIGGFNDWWLPSNQELILMFTNLYKASPRLGAWSNATNLAYRTSTQAKFFVFTWSAAYEGNNFKFDASNWPYPVKPIRGFSSSSGGGGGGGSNSPNNDEEKRREAQRENERRVEEARSRVLTKVGRKEQLIPSDLAAAALPELNAVLLEKANLEIKSYESKELSYLPSLLQTLNKFAVYQKIIEGGPTPVTGKTAMDVGILSSNYLQKENILFTILRMETSLRSSVEVIQETLKNLHEERMARKERTRKLMEQISARSRAKEA